GRGKPRVGGEEREWAWSRLPSIVRHWRSLGEEALPGRSRGVAKQQSRPSRVSHLSIVLSSAVARSSFQHLLLLPCLLGSRAQRKRTGV
ncbi:hypothetical protein E2320_018772, partial [Naja naja]